MADPAMALLDYLRKFGADLDGDFLRAGVQLLTRCSSLREGSFFPSLMEPRKRSEKALLDSRLHDFGLRRCEARYVATHSCCGSLVRRTPGMRLADRRDIRVDAPSAPSVA